MQREQKKLQKLYNETLSTITKPFPVSGLTDDPSQHSPVRPPSPSPQCTPAATRCTDYSNALVVCNTSSDPSHGDNPQHIPWHSENSISTTLPPNLGMSAHQCSDPFVLQRAVLHHSEPVERDHHHGLGLGW